MDSREAQIQERLHSAIQEVVRELAAENDGDLVTGWVLCYETQSATGGASAGHFYGPRGLTAWRALGLVEWVRSICIPASLEDDDEE